MNHSELVYQPFARDDIMLIVAPDHPWADGRTVTPEDLLTEPFVGRETTAGAYEVLAAGLARHGVDIAQLQTVLTLTNAEAIEVSVEAGIGVAFVSRLAAASELALGRVVEVPVAGMDLTREIYLVRRLRRTTTPLQQAFWDFALEETTYKGRGKTPGVGAA
jgi:DNA-binding transcriptional LysR family regulator